MYNQETQTKIIMDDTNRDALKRKTMYALSDCKSALEARYIEGAVKALKIVVDACKEAKDSGVELVTEKETKSAAYSENYSNGFWLDDISTSIMRSTPNQKRILGQKDAVKRKELWSTLNELWKASEGDEISKTPQKWIKFIGEVLTNKSSLFLNKWIDAGGRCDMLTMNGSQYADANSFSKFLRLKQEKGLPVYGSPIKSLLYEKSDDLYQPVFVRCLGTYWPYGISWKKVFESCSEETLRDEKWQNIAWKEWADVWGFAIIGGSEKAIERRIEERMLALDGLVRYTRIRPGVEWYAEKARELERSVQSSTFPEKEKVAAISRCASWENKIKRRMAKLESDTLKRDLGINKEDPSSKKQIKAL
jgi:hypothetical protein